MEYRVNATFLTLASYEESLLRDQTSQEWDREAVLQTEDQRRYNLRLRTSNFKENLAQRAVGLTEQQINKQKRPVVDPIILKAPAQEVRGPNKSPSPFSFESEV